MAAAVQGLTTDIYSADALELVRDHLFRIIGQQGGQKQISNMQMCVHEVKKLDAGRQPILCRWHGRCADCLVSSWPSGALFHSLKMS